MQSFKSRTLLASTALTLALSCGAQALPTGGSVSVGTAKISSTANQTTVTQSSQNAVINWTGFNTTKGQTVQINDPNYYSITINRVSGSATSFDGALKSNGNVVVINPNGVLIGQDGNINTTSFVATTSNITDANFTAGKYNFTPGGGAANAAVSNEGSITVAQGGLAALVGPNVANSGVINAHADKITLASGDTYTVDLASDGLINLAASKAMTQQGLSNTGTLNAAGGSVVITAAQASNVLDNLINLDGFVEANSLTASNQSGDLEYGAKFTGSTGGSFALSAYRNVTVDQDAQIAPAPGLVSGVNKLNVTIDANDTGASGGGSIYLANGTAINSNGGNITLGGGTNPVTGYAVGNNAPGIDQSFDNIYSNGVYLGNTTLNAGGGNIVINGQGAAENNGISFVGGDGVANSTSSTVGIATSGNGNITINGIGGAVPQGSSFGTFISEGTVSAANGDITINGTSGESVSGSGVYSLYSKYSTVGGTITFSGKGDATPNSGSFESDGVTLGGGSISTASGPVKISGQAGSGLSNYGTTIWDEAVSSAYGNIQISGSGVALPSPGATLGVSLSDDGISSSGTGSKAATISVNGTGVNNGYSIVTDEGAVSTVDGNVTFTGNSPILIQDGTQFITTGKGKFAFYPGAIVTE